MKLTKPFLAFSIGSALAIACASTEEIGDSSSGGHKNVGGMPPTGGKSASSLGGSSTANGRGGSTTSLGGNSDPSGFGGGLFGLGGSSSALGGSNGALGGNSSTAGNATTGGTGGIPTSVIENASVVLYHQSDVTDAATTRIFMRFFIENKSPDPLPLAQVSVRYWMTSEVNPPTLHSYYQGPSIAGESLSYVEAGPNSYVDIHFTGNSINRGADLNASEFQLQIDGGSYNQADDYSFNPADTQRRANDKITLYVASRLVWGCEPSGACPGGDVGAGGAGGAPAGGAGGILGVGGSPTVETGGTDSGGAPSEGGAAPSSGGTAASSGGSASGGTASGGTASGGTATGSGGAAGTQI